MKLPEHPGRQKRPDEVRARLMLALLCVVWGFGWPSMRIALDDIPPLSMRAATAALAAITLAIGCVVTRRSLRVRTAKSWAHVAVASLFNIVGFTVLTAYAQLEAATGRVAILAYTMPIWSVLLAWPLLGERPRGVQALALGLCCVGLAILIYPLATKGIPLGIVLAVGGGVSWAAGTVYLKWARIDGDVMAVAAWQLVIAFAAIAPFMLMLDGGFPLRTASDESLVALLFVGVVSGGVAYGLWFEIIELLPATTASLGVLGAPVIGVLSSAVILGEVPTAADVIGFALILAASACVLLAPSGVRAVSQNPDRQCY